MAKQPLRPISNELAKSQKAAMRWLAEQGMTPEEIQALTWGSVDESERTITVQKPVTTIVLDRNTGICSQTTEDREMKLSVKGTEHEWFFCKSKTPSMFYVFVKAYPRSWRREAGQEALYSLSVIRNICKGHLLSTSFSIRLLTEFLEFAKMDLSNLNITNKKSKEPIEITSDIREALIVKET